jgi:hypothetical protein
VEINRFFTTEEINQLAKQTQFVQREGKIDGQIFLELIVFNHESLKQQSLNDLSSNLESNYHIDITKQSLHERFNSYALIFLQRALEHLLQHQVDSTLFKTEISGIKRILIKDSVCFQVDESLNEIYCGSGGDGSSAAVRIQFEYDLLNGHINDLSLHAFCDQDAPNSLATLEKTKAGDVILRDLAYLNLDFFEQLAYIRQAFYLFRAHPTIYIYEKKEDGYVKIDFSKITNYMKQHNLRSMEKEVYLGQQKKLKTRLIIYLLPEQQVAERLRKARKRNKKDKRKTISNEFKARVSLNLFITNTSYQQIPTALIWLIYKIRWQIELMFKIWKSLCHIEKVKKVNRYRLQCYIYAKLIALGWHILWVIAKLMFKIDGKALSYYKAYKTLLSCKLNDLKKIMIANEQYIADFIRQLYHISRKRHVLEIKKHSVSSLEIRLLYLKITLA